MMQIRRLWNKHFPEQRYTCRDIYSIYMSQNQDVVNFSHLFLTYSLLSLFLTILGLFGIAWFASEQRTREISIRKVNGATIRQIILLLNRPFLVYIRIAYTIAIPITYFLMIKWREQYVYKAYIGIEVFIIPLLIISIMTILTVSMNSWRSASANPINAIKE